MENIKILSRLLKDILWKPIWGVFLLIWAVIGHIEQLASILGYDFYPFLIKIKEIQVINFVLVNWLWFGIVTVLVGIISNLFRIAMKYLPSKYTTNKIQVEIKTEFIAKDQYIFLQVTNNEEQDLRDCYLVLKKLIAIRESENVDFIDYVNPNMSMFSWPLFRPDQEKIVRQKTTARVNIGNFNELTNRANLTLENGNSELYFVPIEKYYIELSLNGELSDKNIREIIINGFLSKDKYIWTEYGATITTTKMDRDKIIKTVEKEPDRKRVSKFFTFKEGKLDK